MINDKNTSSGITFSSGFVSTPHGNCTESQLIKIVVKDYISNHLRIYRCLPSPEKCAADLVEELSSTIIAENSLRPSGTKMKVINDLPAFAVTELIAARDDVALIIGGNKGDLDENAPVDKEKLPIAIYQSKGPNAGIWKIVNGPGGEFGMLVEEYMPGADTKYKKEVFNSVQTKLPVKKKCMNPYYVPCCNCIYDVKNKEMIRFNKDIVFTSKFSTNYNPDAQNVHYTLEENGEDWDVISWLENLAPNEPDFFMSILEVFQASLMPLAPFNQCVLFYSETGNSGKGTICELIRQIIGKERTVSIAIADFCNERLVTKLIDATAVITDENDVNGSWVKSASNLKQVVTGDTLSVRRLYKEAIDIYFNGIVIQCINAFPSVADKTGALSRRWHIIGFPRCFTGTGVEVKSIKQSLITKREVKEYLLKYVLDLPYKDTFTETESSRSLLHEFTRLNNSVQTFMEEMLPECRWDLLPAKEFLYPLYRGYYKELHPNGYEIGYHEFLKEVKKYISKVDTGFVWSDSCAAKNRIAWPEPLITEYRIDKFANFCYPIGDNRRNNPPIWSDTTKYAGLQRKYPGLYNPANANNVANSKNESENTNETDNDC